MSGSVSAAVPVSEGDLAAVARAVWDATLGLGLDGIEPAPPVPDPRLAAVVSLSGGFEGAVSLELSTAAGREIASLMFGLGVEEISWEDTADAVGELANIVGGNVKALLGRPAALSLPSVVALPPVTPGPCRPAVGRAGPVARGVTMGFGRNVVRIALHASATADPPAVTDVPAAGREIGKGDR